MMDAFDLASRLFGNSRAESRGDVTNSLDILTATGAGDSSDGAATVYLDADVTPADDYDGDDYAIGIPTSPNVIEGDGVLVGLTGSGPLKTPVVISNPGSGDRMQVQISNAETLAEQAEAVATATGQHFWSDTDGAHVTEAAREDWETTHTGANSLWNSLGMLFRDGLNNLLAVLTSGIAIYDGNGNAASNVLAEFMADHVRVGGNVPVGSGGTDVAGAAVQFFDQTDTHGSGIEAAMSLDEAADYYDMRSNVGISSQLTDAERATDTGSTGNASLSLEQWMGYGITGTGEQFTETHSALVADSTYDGDGQSTVTSHARVSATATTGNIYANGTSYVELIGDALGIGENEGAIDYYRAEVVKSAIVPVTLFTGTYAQTYNTSVTLSEPASNFSRLMFVCENNDGERTSVTVTDPNGKYFNVVMLTIAGPSGTGTYAYMKAKSFSINGTSVTCRTYTYNGQTIYRHGSVTLRNGVAVAATQASEEIGIVKVLGWR